MGRSEAALPRGETGASAPRPGARGDRRRPRGPAVGGQLHPGGPAAVLTGLAGLRHAGERRGGRLVASSVEHSALLAAGRYAAAQADTASLLDEVPVERSGRVDLDAWAAALGHPGTVVAALQSANAEVGTRQPLGAAHEACRRAGVPLLVDAQAGLGRDPVPHSYDVLAGQAGSWGGPPGVGVLVVPARTRWWRPGPPTEAEGGRTDVDPPVPWALAAAEAWRQTAAVRQQEAHSAHQLVDRIRSVAAGIADTEVAGDAVDRLPHVVTFSCLFAAGEALVTALDRLGFAVASGSACTASTVEPSHVLAAMGALTHGNIRVTLPLAAVDPAVDRHVAAFLDVLPPVVTQVRAELGAG